MDWKDEFPSVTGIDRVVVEMAQRLMQEPVSFKSPFWDGEIVIKDLNDYRAWVRLADRIENERRAGLKALAIWEEERHRKLIL